MNHVMDVGRQTAKLDVAAARLGRVLSQSEHDNERSKKQEFRNLQ